MAMYNSEYLMCTHFSEILLLLLFIVNSPCVYMHAFIFKFEFYLQFTILYN